MRLRTTTKSEGERLQLAGQNLFSVMANWGSCWIQHDYDLSDFVDHCIADNSPEARVFTANAQELAPSLDAVLTSNIKVTPDWPYQLEVPIASGNYPQLRMRTTIDGVSDISNCVWRACAGAYMCTIPEPNNHGLSRYDVLTAVNNEGTLTFQALDANSCTNGMAQTEWSTPQSWYFTDSAGYCPAPPPDPDPEPMTEGTWWDLECLCASAFGTATANLNGCLNPAAAHPQVGAQLQCSSAELQIENVLGINVECTLDSLSNTGGGPCWPGAYTVESIE